MLSCRASHQKLPHRYHLITSLSPPFCLQYADNMVYLKKFIQHFTEHRANILLTEKHTKWIAGWDHVHFIFFPVHASGRGYLFDIHELILATGE